MPLCVCVCCVDIRGALKTGQFIFTAVPIWPTLWPVRAAVPRFQVRAEAEPEPAPGRRVIYQRLAVADKKELHTFVLKIKFKPVALSLSLLPSHNSRFWLYGIKYSRVFVRSYKFLINKSHVKIT